jgi:hypothetical protein
LAIEISGNLEKKMKAFVLQISSSTERCKCRKNIQSVLCGVIELTIENFNNLASTLVYGVLSGRFYRFFTWEGIINSE